MCNKCEGLHACFGWGGLVKVCDETGHTYGPEAHDIFYGDFYRDKNALDWPTCPECGRSLDLLESFSEPVGGIPQSLALILSFLLGASFWSAVWYFFFK